MVDKGYWSAKEDSGETIKYIGPSTRNGAKAKPQIALSKANRLMDDLFNEGKPSAVQNHPQFEIFLEVVLKGRIVILT